MYEYEIAHSPAGVGPLNWQSSDVGKINTQEHILPQQHRDGGWWATEWPDEAEADRFKHRLGNLTLTSNNVALGRKPIALKILDASADHYFTHAHATNSEKQISAFTDGVTWKPGNILQREYKILQFATKRWAIPCRGDNGTIALPTPFSAQDASLASISVNERTCVSEVDVDADTDGND